MHGTGIQHVWPVHGTKIKTQVILTTCLQCGGDVILTTRLQCNKDVILTTRLQCGGDVILTTRLQCIKDVILTTRLQCGGDDRMVSGTSHNVRFKRGIP